MRWNWVMPRTYSSARSPEYSPTIASNSGCGTTYLSSGLAGDSCAKACGAIRSRVINSKASGRHRGRLMRTFSSDLGMRPFIAVHGGQTLARLSGRAKRPATETTERQRNEKERQQIDERNG